MKNVCSNCGNPETTTQPTISYEWDEKRGAEEIIYRSMTHCEAHGCPAHVTTETRRGNYRVSGEGLDAQREKLHLLWEFYSHIIEHRLEGGIIVDYLHDDSPKRYVDFSVLLDELKNLWTLRKNAIAVAKERKEQS